MDIDWYGQSCFRLREGSVTIVTDPYDKSIGYNLPRLRADLVTCSHDAPGHSNASAVKGDPKVLTRPGEYEVKGVFITGIQTWRGGSGNHTAKEENTVFVFEFGEMTVCHLGDLSRVLTQAQVESMPNVDILLAPVGDGTALDADKAAEVISQLEPRLVIPMHYLTPYTTLKLDPLSKFLKEMGVPESPAVEMLRTTRSQLPQETQVVVLECKQA
ncbi:MAG: metal-dependent hydrolase [Chloroflexi bacterium ADurb.Bin325]|nr:MAG: metal-dependent hydrolase [Chloroflexi bacterium ADurb.Bin325]